jgi:hypothetical protein
MPADSAGSTPPARPPPALIAVISCIMAHNRRASSRRRSPGTRSRYPATEAPVGRIAGLFLVAMPSWSHSRLAGPAPGWEPRRRATLGGEAGSSVLVERGEAGSALAKRGEAAMPGMKVTVSAAMRARDVSRPQPQHQAAAEQNSLPARPRARAAPRPPGNPPGQAMPPAPPPAPQGRPAPPGPRPGDAIGPERGKVPRPAPRPARESRQQDSPPGRGSPGAGRPDEPRDPRGSVTAKESERPPEDSGSRQPAARGRSAKRKRVRRRRSHGR